jgi:hypothetical protein
MSLRLIFRVPSQYKHLRLTQRVTCLQKTRKFQRYIKEKGTVQQHGNRNSEVV